MGYQNMLLEDLVNKIEQGTLILPAIQRGYVWDEKRICDLFDSLMRDYPVGSFLFWEMTEKDFNEFTFHHFLKEVDKTSTTPVESTPVDKYENNMVAVLDGQQRLTSLYIGLKGSYTSRVKKEFKDENGQNPERFLCLNLLSDISADNDESFEFQFLSKTQIDNSRLEKSEEVYWYKVSDIFDFVDSRQDPWEYCAELFEAYPTRLTSRAQRNLGKLINVVFQDATLSCFPAKKKSLNEVARIFERVNNNGVVLTGADLMLSMASATKKTDMQKEINDALKRIKEFTEKPFRCDREFVLTAALMAIDSPTIASKRKESYSTKNIEKIIENWDRIIDSICQALYFLEKLGFQINKLKKVYVYPVALYFYHAQLDGEKQAFGSNPVAQQNREKIRLWILTAQAKKLFAEGSGVTILAIRKIMNEERESGNKVFPLEALCSDKISRDMKITRDTIEDILSSDYTKALPWLMVIGGSSYDKDVEFHEDHIWPKSVMRDSKKIKKVYKEYANEDISDEDLRFYQDNYNTLVNLQPLNYMDNSGKGDKLFDVWLNGNFTNLQEVEAYKHRQYIPQLEDYGFHNFKAFIKERKKLLRKRLIDLFDVKDEED